MLNDDISDVSSILIRSSQLAHLAHSWLARFISSRSSSMLVLRTDLEWHWWLLMGPSGARRLQAVRQSLHVWAAWHSTAAAPCFPDMACMHAYETPRLVSKARHQFEITGKHGVTHTFRMGVIMRNTKCQACRGTAWHACMACFKEISCHSTIAASAKVSWIVLGCSLC